MKENNDNIQLLLIDDDPNLIMLVQDYLEFRGYEVITAENGYQALEALEENIPDLIICDIMMPEMDGYSFVEQIRQNPSTEWLPVIFLSAKSQSKDRIKGLNMGGDVYMTKPFEPEELVAQVESSLKQANRLLQHSNKIPDLDQQIVVSRKVELTPTEIKVVNLVAQGLVNREIAKKLKVSQRTIESHISNMLNKTNLHNRTELARWAMKAHLFDTKKIT